MSHKIKFKISPWRIRKGVKLPPKPIKPSEYFLYLSKIGAGFKKG